jgi:hypothetical protein
MSNQNDVVGFLTFSFKQMVLDEPDSSMQEAEDFFAGSSQFGDINFQFTFEPAVEVKDIVRRAMSRHVEPPIRKVNLKTYSEWQAFANGVRARGTKRAE